MLLWKRIRRENLAGVCGFSYVWGGKRFRNALDFGYLNKLLIFLIICGASYFESQNSIGLAEGCTASYEGWVSRERWLPACVWVYTIQASYVFKVNCIEYDSINFSDFAFWAHWPGMQTWIGFTVQALTQSEHPARDIFFNVPRTRSETKLLWFHAAVGF